MLFSMCQSHNKSWNLQGQFPAKKSYIRSGSGSKTEALPSTLTNSPESGKGDTNTYIKYIKIKFIKSINLKKGMLWRKQHTALDYMNKSIKRSSLEYRRSRLSSSPSSGRGSQSELCLQTETRLSNTNKQCTQARFCADWVNFDHWPGWKHLGSLL